MNGACQVSFRGRKNATSSAVTDIGAVKDRAKRTVGTNRAQRCREARSRNHHNLWQARYHCSRSAQRPRLDSDDTHVVSILGATSRRQFLSVAGVTAAGALVGGPFKLLAAKAATTTTTALPDLVVTAISLPHPIAAGQLVTFGVTVKNQGTAATPTGVLVGVGFDIDSKEVAWSGSDFTALPAGASITLKATAGPGRPGTWTATAGNHVVRATVNDVNRFPELSTINNSRSLAFTVAAAATKPVNVTLPVVTGVPTVGQTLSASQGTWS